jgi:hypothetical protein
MRTLALCGASCKDAPFSIVRGQRGKVFSFYLYLWSRVVSGGPGPCGLGLWASRMNFAQTEFSEVRGYNLPSDVGYAAADKPCR